MYLYSVYRVSKIVFIINHYDFIESYTIETKLVFNISVEKARLKKVWYISEKIITILV